MSRTYEEKDLLRLARRIHNTKRQYLLVDPLQGKHIPVSPKEALKMMSSLGDLVGERYPGCTLVIGFAETATAVGMAVALRLGEECAYIHTTREEAAYRSDWIEFLEEHSHAAEQKLASSKLEKLINETETIVFVDDEISTGKTLLNIIRQLKSAFGQVEGKKLVAASVINRLSEENRARLRAEGAESIALLEIEEKDYTAEVLKYPVSDAAEVKAGEDVFDGVEVYTSKTKLPDPRTGVMASFYEKKCRDFAEEIRGRLPAFDTAERILVMGTEECMYPAMYLGSVLEDEGCRVMTHSTTRSPIGICSGEGYPIVSGFRLKSFYDSGRTAFIYDLTEYDRVIVVTDSRGDITPGLGSLCAALKSAGCGKIYAIRNPATE